MLKNAKGVKLDTELTSSDLKELVEQYKNVYLETKGEKFPSGTKYDTKNLFIFPSFLRKIFLLANKECIIKFGKDYLYISFPSTHPLLLVSIYRSQTAITVGC